jgi:hypothetical protein
MDDISRLIKRAKRHIWNDEKEAAIVVLEQVEEKLKNSNAAIEKALEDSRNGVISITD